MSAYTRTIRSRLGALARKWGRPVLDVPEAARFGNNLYFWLAAWRSERMGERLLIKRTINMEQDLAWFPEAKRLTVDEREIRRIDTPLKVPKHHFQRFGIDFNAADLSGFVHEVVLSSKDVQQAIGRSMEAAVANSVTLNVRRGDYYSDSRYRPRYAMDLDRYLHSSLALAVDIWPIDSVTIVSDDPEWCRLNLTRLSNLGVELRFPNHERSVLQDFGDLCAAKYLILSNSSFSQWGAHVSASLNADPSRVIAPTFGVRGMNQGRAWQINPLWQLIDNASEEESRTVT